MNRRPVFCNLRPVLAVAAALVCLFVAAAAVAAPSLPANADIIGLDEIRPGMTGYGLSVFRGSAVDTFGVKVIDVQSGTRPAGSLILVEISGQGLEVARVVQGMSGSPVFVEGRFAGALAFGWSGSLSPIAGVTPAAEILALPTEAVSAPRRADAAAGFDPRQLAAGATPDAAAPLATSLGAGFASAAAAAPVSGLGIDGWPSPRDLALALLPATADGSGTPDAAWICRPVSLTRSAAGTASGSGTAAALQPGSSCAIPLVTGDAQLGAIGTVTWVDGDRVYMMGHPFLQRGPVTLPLATADIATILPNRQMSFKMGSIGPIVGAVHHDRRAGLGGRLGAEAPLVPIEVVIQDAGGASRTFEFGVVDDVQLTPSLVFWTLYNSLLVEGSDAAMQTVNWRLEADWSGDASVAAGPLVLSGVTSGPDGVRALASQWMAPLSLLMNNPFAAANLEGVRAVLKIEGGLREAAIRSVTGPRTSVQPGEEVVYRVSIDPRGGKPFDVEVPVTIPAHLAPGPYRIAVASAAEFFALEAQRAAGRFQVRTLDDTIGLLQTPRSRTSLVLALLAPGSGLVLGGREMTALPGSVQRVLRRGDLQAQPTLADFVLRREIETDWALAGHAVLEFRIPHRSAPRTEERRP